MSRRTEQIREARLAAETQPPAKQHEAGIALDLLPLATPLADLYQLPGNPRRGDVEAVMRSYVTFGQMKPIVAQRDGMIIAGNHQYQAAKALGWQEIAVVRSDFDWVTAEAFALADNRTSELGSYDPADLLALIDSVQADGDAELFAAISFSDEAIAEIRKALADSEGGAVVNGDPDEVPEPPAEPFTKPGDLWLLGEHRVLCGDSTKAEDVQRLMGGGLADMVWTDPPYGVNYVGKTKDALTIRNDGADGLQAFLASAFRTAGALIRPGSPFYVASPPGMQHRDVRGALGDAGWAIHEGLIWVKDVFVLGHSDYHLRHEDILYGWLPGPGRSGRGNHEGSRWHGDHSQDSVFEVPRPKRSETHPTMKPVELIARMVANSSSPSEVVLDLFGGSGSTLIAAHGLNRVARLIEIDPVYVDVICRRFEEAFDIVPILESTGEPHSFKEPALT